MIYSIATQIDRFPFDFPIIKEIKNKIFIIAHAVFFEKQEMLDRQNHYQRLFKVIENFNIKHSNREKEWDKNDPIRSYVDWNEILEMRKNHFFRKEFTYEEWFMIHPHVIEEEKKIEFNDNMYGNIEQSIRKKKELERIEESIKDPFFMIRIAFKISCIFFCIYMAYPMI